MTQIIDRIFIAGVDETYSTAIKSKVTHFLNVASEIVISERVDHIYTKIAIPDDDEYSDITTILDDCLAWIYNAIKNGGSVCIHCLEGKSRSVCVCIAYICVYMKYTYDDAYIIVVKKRPHIDIYPLYESQLRSWLEKYQG